MRYVSREIETNAWQFDGENWAEIQDVVGKHQIDVDAWMPSFIEAREMWVDIPEGITALVWVEPSKQWAGVKPGDYIVEDADGNFYPCEKSIFERKYREVEDATVVQVSGPITSSEIQKAIGKMIQQSSRFK